mgnify:CR=1 FL=1
MAKYLDDNGLLYLWTKIKAAFVSKETGKGLSTNDYTTDEKTKLSGIEAGANKTTVVDNLTSTSATDALSAAQGKALKASIDSITTDIGALGGGDMMKATYDTNGNGTVDDAEKLGGQAPSYYAKASDIPTVDSALSGTSTNPVQNKAVHTALAGKANTATTLEGYGITDAYKKTEVYAKTEVYTQAETDNKISTAVANAGHLKRTIVETLPAVGEADANTIYMKVEDSDSSDNKYVEWMVINGAWEKVGTSDVDLSGYLQKTEITAITNSEIDTVVAS